jgi:phage terminase large subunit
VAPAFQPAATTAKRYIGLHGGRGSGKSQFAAEVTVLKMNQGIDCLCGREIQESIKDSSKKLVESKIAQFGLAELFHITDAEIRHRRTGASCVFKGLLHHTVESLKSIEGVGWCWIEEAHTISQKSLDILRPTIRAPGSQMCFTWNPTKESDPVDVFFRQNPPESSLVIEANWNDNPWFPEELRADMEEDRARDHEKFLHIWEGKYQTLSEARIFRNFRVGELTPPPRTIWRLGVDFGFAVDPTAALRCCLIDDRTLYIDHEVYEPNVPTEALPALIGRIPESNLWPATADSARPETIDYLRRHGFPKLRGATKGKGSVEDGISFLQGLDIVINPRCPNTIREFGSYAYRIDKRTAEILPEPEDANNHAIDALRYACERLHRKGRLLAEPQDEKPPPGPPDYGNRRNRAEADNWKVA